MYKKGDLKQVDKKCGKNDWCDCSKSHTVIVYDARTDNDDEDDIYYPNVYLPHSCDQWVIGGKQEIEWLIEDLKGIFNA